jgi:hypothetical protein
LLSEILIEMSPWQSIVAYGTKPNNTEFLDLALPLGPDAREKSATNNSAQEIVIILPIAGMTA